MSVPDPRSAEALANEALAAFRRGDRTGARSALDAIASLGEPGDVPFLLIGQLEDALGNDSAAAAAFTRQLERVPRDLVALLMMGALKARLGDDRAANVFYRAALNVVGQSGSPPPALMPSIQAAQRFLEAAGQRFADHLQRAVNDVGLATARGHNRLALAIDLLLGRSEIFLQQPSMFYFPGLPQRAFYEREEFSWLAGMEAQAAAMSDELDAMIADANGFAPYVQRTPDRPAPANRLLDDPKWSAQFLWKSGVPGTAAASCPVAMAAMEQAPLPIIPDRSPMALFSMLQPGTHIEPHHGLLNTRLICHLPLIAPPDCALRVGAETRSWQFGEAVIFDDSIEHEAWNRGQSVRVVLLFEIWRPELTEPEQRGLTEIFAAIDSYQGKAEDAG